MDSRSESLPMSPTKHFVAIFGPTPPISQSDIMRSDDFQEDGDLCGEEDEGEDASWQSNPVGSSLGLLAAIKEEDSGDEKSPKRLQRVYPVDNSLAEKLSYGYFDYPLTKKPAPIEKPAPETTNVPNVATDLDTDHFGRPRTAERPKTPSPEKREQKKHEPFVRSSSAACIDCIVGGKDHHHGRAPVQSPPPSRTSFPKGSLSSSLKRASSDSVLSEPTSASISGIQTSSTAVQRPPNEASTSTPTPTLRRTGSLPVRELVPSRDLDTFSNPINEPTAPVLRRVPTLHRELTPPREQASSNLSIPTPPKEPDSNPYERTPPKPNNPTTPARQRVPAIPPTPPSTPARRKSLPHDFSKAYINLPTPVEEEPPTISTQTVDENKVVHGHSHSHSHGEDDTCPFVTRARSFRDMRQTKSYSYNPSTPESARRLSHSYSAPDIHNQRRSSSLPSNTDPSRVGMLYSRPTTPELSRLSQSYSYSRPGSSDGSRRPGSSDGLRRPGSSDGLRRPGSSDGFRRPGSSDGFRRPGSSDGSRLTYTYSRPTTPDVGFGGSRGPFLDGSESTSWSPAPPPPTIASSVGTSPASSLVLSRLGPAIDFKKDTTQRTISRSISENDLHTIDRFFGSLQRRLAEERENQMNEPESPVEELTPKIETVIPEIPKIEITESEVSEPEAIEVVPQSFIAEFVIPRITKYYFQGQTFWNIVISFWLFFFVLGSLVTVSTGFVYFFGDGTVSSGLRGTLFDRGTLLEDLSPLIAILLYTSLFAWVTVYSRRAINPEAEEVKKKDLLAEIFGSQQATSIKKRFSRRKMKVVLLLCLITAGMRGLYLGGQIVGPPIVAGVNKGVTVGVDYWNTIRAPTTEVSTETEAEARVSDPWEDMDFMYFQSNEGVAEGKYASSMEGSQGTYYPSAEDQGYFGDEEGLGWGSVIRLGLALFAGPAGAMAWRHRRR